MERGTSLAHDVPMAVSLFSVIGVVAVLGVGVAGIGASMLVKDRIRIEVYDDAPKDDGLALVRDDVRSVQSDLQALTQALSEQLGRVGEALAQQDQRGASEAKSVLDAVLNLERALGTQTQRLAQLEQQVAALSLRSNEPVAEPIAVRQAVPIAAPVPEPEPPVPSAAPTGEPESADPRPAETLPAETPRAETPPAETPPTETAKAAPKGKAFLGFQLPSRTFRFDQLQQFEVVADLSRVGFDAKSTLHDFSGVTSKVAGGFAANLADPATSFTGSIACEAKTLVTGVEGRDTAMCEHLDTEKHEQIRFTIESFTPDVDGIDAAKLTLAGTVNGTFEIRGVKKAVTMPVKLAVDASRRLSIEGQTKLSLPDFGVPVPSQLGLISMEPDVVVWVALRARVAAGAARAR